MIIICLFTVNSNNNNNNDNNNNYYYYYYNYNKNLFVHNQLTYLQIADCTNYFN